MKVSLLLNSTQLIDSSYIEGFSFISDKNSFYTKSKIFLKTFDLEYINRIKVGTLISVIFYEDNNPNLFFVNPMTVISSRKISRGYSDFDDQVELVLSHFTFFKNNTASMAHGYSGSNNMGSSISNIINTLISKEYPSIFSSLNIEETDDFPSIRYQINENNIDFMERIMIYACKNSLPAYLFTDARNILNLRCISNIATQTPTKCLLAETLSKEALQKESINKMSKILMKRYSLQVDANFTNASIKNKFTSANFKFNDPSKKPISTIEIPGNIFNNQFSLPTPTTTLIQGWNLTPSDAASISARNCFERNISAYTLMVDLAGIKLQESIPGTLLHVVFPAVDPKSSIDPVTGASILPGEGNYMVERSMIGYNDKMWTTTLKLTYIS